MGVYRSVQSTFFLFTILLYGVRVKSMWLEHCSFTVRIPTDIGDSSRYTLPLPAFRLRTDDFSSMHTTPRKMCPRHQKICCKNPFPKMLSFFGFGTRRHFTVGCFIDIFGAKTTQKHCSFWQLTLRRDQATNIIISTSFLHSEKTRQYKTPRNTDI